MPSALALDVAADPEEVGPVQPRRHCACCAGHGALAVPEGQPALCALCWLAGHLNRPRIDEEARLIWLPEAEQRVISVLCAGIHEQLYRAHEPLHDDAVPHAATEASMRLYHARAALAEREPAAEARLGTSQPSELAEALRQLPAETRARQPELLAGLRLLPRGRFFDRDIDVYPAILRDTLSAITPHQPGPQSGASV